MIDNVFFLRQLRRQYLEPARSAAWLDL